MNFDTDTEMKAAVTKPRDANRPEYRSVDRGSSSECVKGAFYVTKLIWEARSGCFSSARASPQPSPLSYIPKIAHPGLDSYVCNHKQKQFNKA
jgi:hypothetical protein